MDSFIRKALKEKTWYPFGQYQEPTAENGWKWRMPKQRYEGRAAIEHEDGAIDKVYQTLAENPKESLEITVNCIVGMNGSGKSSLLDILYRIINNFSYRLIDEAWIENTPEKNPQRGHYLSYAHGFEATLFFESDGVLGSIYSCYENVYFSYYSESKDARFEHFKIERPISNTKLEQITRHMFYTICTNYSIHSLNELDYTPNPLWLEYSDSNINGRWIKGLFHKNDGYVVPITMVPYRNEDECIDINNENYLAKQRLATLAVLFASQGKPFLNDYRVEGFKCRFNHKAKNDFDGRYKELFKKSFPSNKQSGKLKKEITDCWKKNLIGYFDNDFLTLQQVVKNTILAYLSYKTLKTCIHYRKYGELLGIKSIQGEKLNDTGVSELSIEWSPYSVNTVVKEILFQEPSIHVNQKIQQVLNFIKKRIYSTENLSIPKEAKSREKEIMDDRAFGWMEIPIHMLYSETREGKQIRKPFKTYDAAYLNMPPAFFEWDMVLTKGKNGTPETLSQMSSGERQLLHSLSYIIYHIKNIESVTDGSYRVKYHNISLVFDEAELYYHPDFQKKFVGNLIKMLSWCHINHSIIRGVNLLIVTHSPFVLSDIPLSHTLYLKDGSVVNKEKETFCGNVHEMLGGNFFMEYSIGDVARENIEEIIRLYNQKDDDKKQDNNCMQYRDNRIRYNYIASIIADDYLQKQVKAMVEELNQKYAQEDDLTSLDKQISEMRKQLEELEHKRNLINKQNYND